MAALGVFSKAILKSQTNKIAVKLSLMGKILRASSDESNKIWVNGKRGIVIACPVYCQMFQNTKNITRMQKNKKVFVSEYFCKLTMENVEHLNFLKTDGFLSGFLNMPVELAGDLLASPLGLRMLDVFYKEMQKKTLSFQEKCYHLSRFLHLREALLGIKAKAQGDPLLRKFAEAVANKCHQKGRRACNPQSANC